MGTWGTGIYSNDTAEDVRDICQEIFPFVSVEDGNRIIFQEFAELINSNLQDDDYASFWYALADWQWKHGILTEEIRIKAIGLLSSHAGIANWEESASKVNVNKRIKVLELLKLQLESPMPSMKRPKAKVDKPKHKIGDIIVFRSCTKEEDPNNYIWKIDHLGDHYLFRDNAISNSRLRMDVPYDAHNKYMAMLCVGTEKTLYSEYLPGVYEEHSVYAYYDYISEVKPTADMLQKCGFLPQLICLWDDTAIDIIRHAGWSYTFTVCDSFRETKNPVIVREFSRIRCPEEAQRFHQLLQQKRYLSRVRNYFSIYSAFYDCWEKKVQVENVGLCIDNLLDENCLNPQLLSPQEATMAYQKYRKRSEKLWIPNIDP